MKRVAAPIFRMIRRWVFEGELEDTHVSKKLLNWDELNAPLIIIAHTMLSQMEFFVVADSSVSDDRLWSHKYKLNLKMLPTFISM